MTQISLIHKIEVFLVMAGGIIFLQYGYDREKVKVPQSQFLISPALARSLDLGLHSALASFLWIGTRTELPFLREGYPKFEYDLRLINELDPKFSAPYALSVAVLPYTKYAGGVDAAIEVGKRGVADADLNWKIPFYLAADYHIFKNDFENAAKYFDAAARVSDVPDAIRRFALNYGIYPSRREQTKAIWRSIYETATDEFTRTRAQAYVDHFDIIDYLQTAADHYQKRFGEYPKEVSGLVLKNIIPAIPRDPFGFEFAMYGNLVGIRAPHDVHK